MIASMTAFAREAFQSPRGQFIWELRSVNHRYREIQFKIPDAFRLWEPSWRNFAHQKIQRGKLDCCLIFSQGSELAGEYRLNMAVLDQLLTHTRLIAQRAGVPVTLEAGAMLQWPDMLLTMSPEITALEEPLRVLFSQALDSLQAGREREGQALATYLMEKLERSQWHVARVREQLPRIKEDTKRRMLQRLEEVQISVEPQRLEQEWVFYVQRMDVEEELDRMEAHIHEVSRVLQAEGPMGRRLDFLMQEMTREANTLASKSSHTEITREAVELKVLIEQMREQIQNVE